MVKDGFVIVPPLSPWDEKNKEKIWPDMAYSSFGATEVEAWTRFMGHEKASSPDRSRIIQHWHDRGYRVKPAKMEIFT